jgi:hypothetical protein
MGGAPSSGSREPSPGLDTLRRLILAKDISRYLGDAGLLYWRAHPDWKRLIDILPSSDAASFEVRRLTKLGEDEHSLEDSEDPELPPFLEELTDEEKSRLRFGRTWKPQTPFQHYGPRWGRAMSLAWALLPKDALQDVRSYFRLFNIFNYTSATLLRKMLKEVSDVFKKYGDLLTPHWKMFVNWDTLGGYVKTKAITDFVGDLEDWATGDVIHSMPDGDEMSETKFLDCLEEGMWEFVVQAPNVERANEFALNLEEYSRYPGNWATPGATQVKDSVLYNVTSRDEVGNKITKTYKPRGSKWRSALALHPSQVRRILTQQDRAQLRQKNTAVQKQETGKLRAVVSADDATYLRMDFISQWLEVALKGHPLSTLFMSTSQTVDMWENLARKTEQKDTVKIPLDQSHFDWQQNKRMIARFISVVRRFIETAASPKLKEDLLMVLRSLEIALVEEEGSIVVGTGSQKVYIPIQKGVMSGWRWTALMDTVFNWGELHCARTLVKETGMSDPVISAIAQGDDDQVECPSYGHASALVEAYAIMNFEVNPGKFFVDIRRDEFLRQVPVPGLVSGYLIRGITAVLWRNPISRDPPAGLLRLSEQLKAWNLLLGRGGRPDTVEKLMLLDMTQGNGLSKEEVISLLRTPATVGGLGYVGPDTQKWVKVSPGTMTRDGKLVPNTVRGLDVELSEWKGLGAKWSDSKMYSELANNLELSKAPTVVEEGRIEEVEILKPHPWLARPTGGGIPVSARGRHDLPTTLSSFMLEEAIRNRDWNWIRDSWIDPSLRAVSDRIESNGGRRVWVDWLTGKLPIKLPTIPGWSDLKPSVIYNLMINSVWTRLVGMAKFDMTKVRRYFLTAELSIRGVLRGSDVRLGG